MSLKSEVLQGTLDLMVLKIRLNEGTAYASLLRLSQKGWIRSEWGSSENNRRARFYSIPAAGRRQLARETENWARFTGVIGRILQFRGEA